MPPTLIPSQQSSLSWIRAKLICHASIASMSICVSCAPEKIPRALNTRILRARQIHPVHMHDFPLRPPESAHVLAVEFGHGLFRAETRRLVPLSPRRRGGWARLGGLAEPPEVSTATPATTRHATSATSAVASAQALSRADIWI